MQVDGTADTVSGILAQHVPQADTRLDAPLPMLPALEEDPGLQRDVPSQELLLAAPRIARIPVDVIGVGRNHIRDLRTQAEDRP